MTALIEPRAAAAPTGATEIIEYLKDQARTIVGAAIGKPLVAFTAGSPGMFPYYWQSPVDLNFNSLTYDWINGNLKAGASPATFDEVFTNLYLTAISKVVYQLSTSDQEALNRAQQNATNQQTALLNAWVGAYGSLPAPDSTQTPTDIIVSTIADKWADPATNLEAMQNATDLNALLNKTPASGQPILPVLSNWLNALGSSVTLQNAQTMNNAYVKGAVNALKNAKTENGGLLLDTKKMVPRYDMARPLNEILNDLETGPSITMTMTVTRTSATDYGVSVQGGADFSISIGDFVSLTVGDDAGYFENDVAVASNEVTVEMTFTGVTYADFGPADYSIATGQDWFWMSPVREAIENGSKDVSGYFFSPDPQIDFSTQGPFGLLRAVAFANDPSMTITVTGSDYRRLADQFARSSTVGLSFLGTSLSGGTESAYHHEVRTEDAKSQVTIVLNPPKDRIAGKAVDSRGWILGACTDYPAA